MSHVPCPWEGQILCQGRQAPGPPFWRVSRLNLPGLETNTSTYLPDLAGFVGESFTKSPLKAFSLAGQTGYWFVVLVSLSSKPTRS